MAVITAMSTFGWALLVAIYFVCLVTIGVMCIRKGHWVMFIVGIFFPIMWIVGAVMPPTDDARASA